MFNKNNIQAARAASIAIQQKAERLLEKTGRESWRTVAERETAMITVFDKMLRGHLPSREEYDLVYEAVLAADRAADNG